MPLDSLPVNKEASNQEIIKFNQNTIKPHWFWGKARLVITEKKGKQQLECRTLGPLEKIAAWWGSGNASMAKIAQFCSQNHIDDALLRETYASYLSKQFSPLVGKNVASSEKIDKKARKLLTKFTPDQMPKSDSEIAKSLAKTLNYLYSKTEQLSSEARLALALHMPTSLDQNLTHANPRIATISQHLTPQLLNELLEKNYPFSPEEVSILFAVLHYVMETQDHNSFEKISPLCRIVWASLDDTEKTGLQKILTAGQPQYEKFNFKTLVADLHT
ncbi:MAG TPA: hypothetical protein VN457_05845 [Chlamydiales bacterium]|nr:hypothetical protein [Chlamydiales bacterium]